jgi:hypothetical protein
MEQLLLHLIKMQLTQLMDTHILLLKQRVNQRGKHTQIVLDLAVAGWQILIAVVVIIGGTDKGILVQMHTEMKLLLHMELVIAELVVQEHLTEVIIVVDLMVKTEHIIRLIIVMDHRQGLLMK